MAKPDRRPFISEELAQAYPDRPSAAQLTLASFETQGAEESYRPRQADLSGLRCPRCGSTAIIQTGTCKTCTECAESIGGCS